MQTQEVVPVPQPGERRHFLNVGVRAVRIVRNPVVGRIVDVVNWNGIELAWYVAEDGWTAWRILEPENPIPIDNITVTRAEGPIEQCGKPVVCRHETRPGDGKGGLFHDDWVVSPFTIAQHAFDKWSRTAPQGGGYDKCDYHINWGPEAMYKGRFDLTRPADDFREQFLRGVIFYAGLAGTPRQMARKNAVEDFTEDETRVRYQSLVDSYPTGRDFLRSLLAKYEL